MTPDEPGSATSRSGSAWTGPRELLPHEAHLADGTLRPCTRCYYTGNRTVPARYARHLKPDPRIQVHLCAECAFGKAYPVPEAPPTI